MMTGLSIVLGTSLMLFVGSLAYAIIQDLARNRRFFQSLLSEQLGQNGHVMQNNFHRAARRPVRVLGSFL